MADNLGDRMKKCYENRYRIYLTRRTPVVLRLDGVAFHTLTRKAKKPFDESFSNAMANTASFLVENIQGAKFAYTQSDEISIIMVDYTRFTTDAWYDYNIQKIVSVAAAMATSQFCLQFSNSPAYFDCRAFNIPKEEVVNYLVWRQKDWARNSVQMMAQSIWSQKQLHGKPVTELKKMLEKNETPWENLEPKWKNGTFIGPHERSFIRLDTMIFNNSRIYLEGLLEPEEK